MNVPNKPKPYLSFHGNWNSLETFHFLATSDGATSTFASKDLMSELFC